MNTLFEGLASFEKILLVFGSVLILILMIALVIMMIKGRRVRMLIPFFIIGIIMIAFPSIEVIELRSLKIKMRESTEALLNEPANAGAISSLLRNISRIEQYPNLSAETTIDLAYAKVALGDTTAAYALTDSVLKTMPSLLPIMGEPKIYLTMPSSELKKRLKEIEGHS